MMAKQIPPLEILNKLLHCDAANGRVYWKERPENMFETRKSCKTWNTRFSGKEALNYVASNGYKMGGIQYKKYLAHRIIWCMARGEILLPHEIIDHIDQNPLNNKIENLRKCTKSQNSYNTQSTNSPQSGFRNVSFCKHTNKWRAKYVKNKKVVCLGRYDTKEEAALIVRAEMEKVQGAFFVAKNFFNH